MCSALSSSFRRLAPALLLASLAGSCAPVQQPAPGTNQPKKPGGEKKPYIPQGIEKRIVAALDHVADRDLCTDHAFWTIIHGILGNGPDVMLVDRDTGKKTNAIEHICEIGGLRGLHFFRTPYGLDVQNGPIFVGQGHQDQFIAEIAQIGMPQFRKFVVNGKDYTFDDFINHAQMRASLKENQELSWTLVVLSQYRGTGSKWTNKDGDELTFTDLVEYELDQPLDRAACGGTHRLFGLTWAYHTHLKNGGKTEGIWKRVSDLNAKQFERAKRYQNADGSFSTLYLAGPGHIDDIDRRINTTGHILEWLALAMTDDEIRQDWVERAANQLALMILKSSFDPIDSGSLYHASHGLRLYHARIYGDKNPKSSHLLLPAPPSLRSEGKSIKEKGKSDPTSRKR